MLITTRANIIIGNEFKTNELTEEETRRFLTEIMASEYPQYNIENVRTELANKDALAKVHSVTSGRPLFLFQLASLWVQTGSLADSLIKEIKSSANAIEFLYGRIYEYLSPDAKDVFVTISQIVTGKDLSNLVEKLKYVVNLESEAERFDRAMQELAKLRIVDVMENGFFKIYSPEILQIMSNLFEKRDRGFRGDIISRIKNIKRDSRMDNEHVLLDNANSSRYSKSEVEVISLYGEILNRPHATTELKLVALLNLTDYLFNNRGKKDLAVKTLGDYEHIFGSEARYAKMYATYCWANNQKPKAIAILSELFTQHPNLTRNDKCELQGLLLLYKSISAIEKKDALVLKQRYGETNEQDFAAEKKSIGKEFEDIYVRNGMPLFNSISQISLEGMSPAARQNIITGLYQFVNVCMLKEKYLVATAICDYALSGQSKYLEKHFQQKQSQLKKLLRQK